ncbi:MAG: hypothetical protein AAFX65_11685 [Cyanobacteria bacterium J06638_7]
MTVAIPIQRLAGRPRSIDEEQRTVELVIASESPIAGLKLICSRDAVHHAEVIPVLLQHQNHVGQICGRLERLQFKNGQIIGTARFADAPAADAGWELARSGCAVSVGALPDEDAIEPGREFATCRRWRLLECSLVAVGADALCTTRSLSFAEPMTVSITPADNSQADLAAELLETKRQLREAEIRAACRDAGLDDVADHYVTQYRDDTSESVFRSILREKLERDRIRQQAGRPAAGDTTRQHASAGSEELTGLAGAIHRKLAGQEKRPLWRILGDELRIPGDSADPILRAAWATSDFPIALTEAGERVMLDRYADAEDGVRSLARDRDLTDFREVKFLRMTKFGGVKKVGEGGEFPTNSYSEESAGSLAADQHGAIALLTRVAAMNDDMGAFADLLGEMGSAARRAENHALAAELTGASYDATNSLSGQSSLGIDSIAAATLLLRRQTDANGNKIAFNPSLLVVAPEEEKSARQLLGTYNPNTVGNVNPYPSLRLEVDAELEGGTFYLCDSKYPPLVLGKIGDPKLLEEVEFETGSYRFKVNHDFGVGFVDGRSLVRVAL